MPIEQIDDKYEESKHEESKHPEDLQVPDHHLILDEQFNEPFIDLFEDQDDGWKLGRNQRGSKAPQKIR